VSLAGIEPAAPDLGGLGLSFSRDVMVHAAGIEPALLFRVMEALSHLAQRAKAGLHVNCPRLGCILTTGHPLDDFSSSFLIVSQVSQLRRESNPQQHPFHTQATEGRFAVCVRYCRDLTENSVLESLGCDPSSKTRWGGRRELNPL
jgi:hypothetical protein